MKRIKLTVAYDGTNYCGWQYQPNGVTIEEMLNKALTNLFQTPIMVIGASRTDSGVHARGNVAVFDTESRMPADKISIALNQRLPEDIRIQSSEEVSTDFHPRKVNCCKSYEYKIMNRRIASPLERLYSHFCYYDLNVEHMKQAAQFLVGEHNFKSFCTVKTQTEETVRTIYSLDIDKREDMITLRISGSGFLYNMVRIIAGTLLEVGKGTYSPEYVEEILEARSRAFAGPTMSARGLTLISLEYETEVKSRITGCNKHWEYTLEQSGILDGEAAKVFVSRCESEELEGLLRRVVHQAVRNGAQHVLGKDLDGDRITLGERFGFYTAAKEADGWYSFFYDPVI